MWLLWVLCLFFPPLLFVVVPLQLMKSYGTVKKWEQLKREEERKEFDALYD